MGTKRKTNHIIGNKRTSRKRKISCFLARLKSRRRFQIPVNELPKTGGIGGQAMVKSLLGEPKIKTEPEVEVKEEIQEDCNDTEIDVDVDHFVAEPQPVPSILQSDPNPIEEINLPTLLPGKRCLICFRDDDDPYTPPLKGILPRAKKGLKHPEQVEDDMRIIYLLKMMFQWEMEELNYLMELSMGQSPREWIHLCQPCRLFIFEIQTLEDRMRACRKRIRNMILKSTENSEVAPRSQGNMTRKIRGLLREQVKSNEANAAMLRDGDWKAREQVYYQIRYNGVNPKPFQEDHLVACDQDDNCNEFDSSSPKRDDESGLEKVNDETEAKLPESNPLFNEVFTCPYGCLEYMTSSEKKMNIAEFVNHLIFHSDYPMTCSICKVFLPRDSSVLNGHWQQYHSSVTATPSEKRFLEKQAFVEARQSEAVCVTAPSLSSGVKCTDCYWNQRERWFDTMNKFKIHQALEHPQVARVSCPFCWEQFRHGSDKERRGALKKHMKTSHNVDAIKGCLKSKSCQYCGELLPDNPDAIDWRKKCNFKMAKAFHMISNHGNLIETSFTCTQCSQELPNLKEFRDHAETLHPEVPTMNRNNDNVLQLCIPSPTKRLFFHCGLCSKSESNSVASQEFWTLNSFSSHLTLSHSLYIKWKFEPLNPSTKVDVIWKPVEEHILEMTNFNENFNKTPEENSLGVHLNRPKKKSQVPVYLILTRPKDQVSSSSSATFKIEANNPRPKNEMSTIGLGVASLFPKNQCPEYKCLGCPKLEKMNVDDFIVHLLFHWRYPNKCKSCKLYLPFATEQIEDHWRHHHPNSSSKARKFELAPFCPGNIFGCQNCPEKFTSFRYRNEHGLSSHGSYRELGISKPEICNICNERFLDRTEVRFHKALDHPEIASLSCYYCEELFIAETVEGVQYLDCEALHQHILHNHPKNNGGQTLHLKACDFCGEVMACKYRTHDHIRSHIRKVHGALKAKTTLSCFICYKEVTNLWQHLTTAHARNSICETCGEEMRPRGLPVHNLNKHNVLMEGYTELRCEEEECDFRTVYPLSFKKHVIVNHSKSRERTHKCSFCEKAYFDSGKLKVHEELHRNKDSRPYQCEICGGSYKTHNTLYIHKRLSHQNRKFPSTNRKRTKPKANTKQACLQPEKVENKLASISSL